MDPGLLGDPYTSAPASFQQPPSPASVIVAGAGLFYWVVEVANWFLFPELTRQPKHLLKGGMRCCPRSGESLKEEAAESEEYSIYSGFLKWKHPVQGKCRRLTSRILKVQEMKGLVDNMKKLLKETEEEAKVDKEIWGCLRMPQCLKKDGTLYHTHYSRYLKKGGNGEFEGNSGVDTTVNSV